MRIIGDNSDGFRNEINIEKCLDFKLFEELNPNLQHFMMDVFKGYSLKGKRIHAIRCRVNVKPDFYLHVDDIPKEVYVSVKKGSGNSVHQENLESFVRFLMTLGATEDVISSLKLFHYGDETTDNTGENRRSASQFVSEFPDVIIAPNDFFSQQRVMDAVIERAVFSGAIAGAPRAEYVYHGTAYSGVWASRDEIYDYIHEMLIGENRRGINVGPLTYQVWNRNLNRRLEAERKREQMQFKWTNMCDILKEITSLRKANKQRGTYEGNLDEISSVVFFNRDPQNSIFHHYISSIDADPNEILLVRVTTKQFSKLSNKKVMTRADAYAIKVIDERLYVVLEENEFYLDEDILSLYAGYYQFIAHSGISIKMSDSSSYNLIKLTPNSFNKLFDSFELGAGASLFCQDEEELPKNLALLEGWNTNIEQMQRCFDIFNVTERNLTCSMNLCKQIKQYAIGLIENKIDTTKRLQQIIFNGMYIYEEPYVAYFFMQGNVIRVLNYVKYSITTGSGRSNGDYTIVLKPKIDRG